MVLLGSIIHIPAEEALAGLFTAADRIASEFPDALSEEPSGEAILLLGGITKDGMYIQLGDLIADLTANRLLGRNFPYTVVKQYASPRHNPAQADRILSGVIYTAGSGYLLIMTLSDSRGGLLKGWEFRLNQSDAEGLLMPSLMANAGGWDRYEPNDSQSSAAAIELPFSESSLTISSGDQDWFSFEIPEGENSTTLLDAYTTGEIDTYMELYAPGETMSTAEDDDGGNGSNARIRSPLRTPGTWHLKVRGYSSDTEGSYGLEISLETLDMGPGEPDEGPDQANLLQIGESPVSRSIYYANDEDWFRIDLDRSLAPDEALRIGTTGSVDTVMTLIDQYENHLSGDDDSGQGNNAMIVIGGLSTGTYYAIVSSYGGETGNYQITADIITPERDEYEDDHTIETASLIEIDGQPQLRTFSPAGDIDWVSFQVETEGNYLMKTAGDIDTYMEFYNGDGTLLEDNDDADDHNAMIMRRLSPGTYYMKVTPYDSASSNEIYELSVERLR